MGALNRRNVVTKKQLHVKEPKPFGISLEADCLSWGFSERVSKMPSSMRIVIDGLCGAREREMVQVRTTIGDYWADKITGTLYDPTTGRCLSGDRRLVLTP
jgi:hypothetical protein